MAKSRQTPVRNLAERLRKYDKEVDLSYRLEGICETVEYLAPKFTKREREELTGTIKQAAKHFGLIPQENKYIRRALEALMEK